tara:strand:+ start:549 stop:737 length:189 start_codon:yes stop_codon:yes gene_type:complete
MKAYLLLVHAITRKILIFIVPIILDKFRNIKIPLEKYENNNHNNIDVYDQDAILFPQSDISF